MLRVLVRPGLPSREVTRRRPFDSELCFSRAGAESDERVYIITDYRKPLCRSFRTPAHFESFALKGANEHLNFGLFTVCLSEGGVPLVLTEDDKIRIRDEEVYRSEIRRELDAQKTKPTTRSGQLWGFMQTSLGIWVLSTVVVGLITWGYAQLQSTLQRSNAQLQLIQHADAEAKSRVRQWLNMCKIRWVQSEFATSRFQEWYFSVVKPPEKDPRFTYVIYPVYSEFEDRALISVLTQLRDNVASGEKPSIDQAIAWVGAWNPDVWENKTFDQKVQLAREHLWLSRWGKEQQ